MTPELREKLLEILIELVAEKITWSPAIDAIAEVVIAELPKEVDYGGEYAAGRHECLEEIKKRWES